MWRPSCWRAAGPAQARGGSAAVAAFYEQAANFDRRPGNPSHARPGRRRDHLSSRGTALGAATGDHCPGRSARGPGDGPGLARAGPDCCVFTWRRPRPGAPARYRPGARSPACDTSPRRLRRCLRFGTGRRSARASGHGIPVVPRGPRRRRAGVKDGRATPPRSPLLAGLATATSVSLSDAIPLLRHALLAQPPAPVPDDEDLRWTSLAAQVADTVWDDERWWRLAQRAADVARRRGELSALPRALATLVEAAHHVGRDSPCRVAAGGGRVAAEVTGSLAPAYGRLALTAWKGQSAELSHLIDQYSGDMAQRQEGRWDMACSFAAAVLNNGLGNYEGALVAAEACCGRGAPARRRRGRLG